MTRITSHLILLSCLTALLVLAAGCKKAPPPGQPILVLYAFDAEGDMVKSTMTGTTVERLLGREVHIGMVAGKNVVLAESGVGMTNAAMSVQAAIDRYRPRGVIFTGIAGAIDSTVNIGDIVVCSTWVTHDYGYIGEPGFRPGPVFIYAPDVDSLVRRTGFDMDMSLLRAVRQIPPSDIRLDSIGDRVPQIHVGGVGVSGNTFIDSREKRVWLSETFSALITDMESAAVAQVCYVNNVPCIVFRSASDLAGGSGSETAQVELESFFEVAAGNSSSLLLKLLESL